MLAFAGRCGGSLRRSGRHEGMPSACSSRRTLSDSRSACAHDVCTFSHSAPPSGSRCLSMAIRTERCAWLHWPGEKKAGPSATALLAGSDDDRTAAAMMLKGLTVHMLLQRTYEVQPGDHILIHAAAGGVGLIACQWAKHLGATVIGTVGSDEKAELASAHGCDHPIVYTRENFAYKVKEITDGKGVPAVYDSVGKDTFDDSLKCVRPLGTLAVFGSASGPIPPFDISRLQWAGSAFLTRAGVFNYVVTPDDLAVASDALIDVIQSGAVKIEVNQTFDLADAAEAHRALEGRATTGSTVLLP